MRAKHGMFRRTPAKSLVFKPENQADKQKGGRPKIMKLASGTFKKMHDKSGT